MRSVQVVSVGAFLLALTAGAGAEEVRGSQVAERTTKVASSITWAPSLEHRARAGEEGEEARLLAPSWWGNSTGGCEARGTP